MHLPRWKMTPSDEFQECLSPVIVILSFLQLVNVPFLQQQLLFLHNQKGPTNSACISVDADFSLTNISDHWDLGKTAAPHECKVSAWNQNYRKQNRITKFPKAKTFQALSEAQNKEQHSYKQERSRRLFSTVLSFNWILFRNKQPPLKKPTPQPSNKPYIIKHVKKKNKSQMAQIQKPAQNTHKTNPTGSIFRKRLANNATWNLQSSIQGIIISLAQKDTQTLDAKIYTSETMMSIWRRSFLRVFISCSGSLCIPTQQPLTNILVALERGNTNRE